MEVAKKKPPQLTGNLFFTEIGGIQYACSTYTNIIIAIKWIRRSISRKGNCWANAGAESFFKTIKTEVVYNEIYQNLNQAKLSLLKWIETWYNRKRKHLAIGYKKIEELEFLNNNQKLPV